MRQDTEAQDIEFYDMVIAGAGFAGLTLAMACQSALGPRFRIAVIDPAPGARAPHKDRASAIANDGKRLFEDLGVWASLVAEAQPIRAMVVTDSKLFDPIRPSFLTFSEEQDSGEALAHMIENDILIEALFARSQALGAALKTDRVEGFKSDERAMKIWLASGQIIEAQLLVAADGRWSRVRDLAGIPTSGWSYGQSGLVATVHHERDHDGIAHQHFLPSGPFAILPLKGQRSSLVWTESSTQAERLVALDDLSFHAELEIRFGRQLGAIEPRGSRRAFPLELKIARRFVENRLALIGDAAHVIHPLAGQGLNLGLRDVAKLAECVIGQARLGLDVGAFDHLEHYQRSRRFDAVAMGMVTDGLNRLFSNAHDAMRFVRDIGLGLVDRMPVKRFFMRGAAEGRSSCVPHMK